NAADWRLADFLPGRSGFRGLILTLAFFDVTPIDLSQIELVAIRIFESDERASLALVDDFALEKNALGFQRADCVLDRTLQLQTDRHRPLSASRALCRGRVKPDGKSGSCLNRSPVIAETISEFQHKRLGIE